ncbi:lycopene cyclase domain-containing protein [Negadavirga shengliensis]|uniref:Lycopene cyclase domain-containing protein n=1 Tax=Negadavirga shengliensis TaxID=1389218 RepID=A0ABV9T184_9BACT
MENYYYLGLLVITLAYPLLQSFERRIQYYKKWYALGPAVFIPAALYIYWDHWFTAIGVWGFNPRYVIGIYLFGLPMEEIMFFFIVPFACVFIYEVMIYFVKRDILRPFAHFFVYLTAPLFFILGTIHIDKLYTAINFLLTGIILLIHFIIFKNKYLGRFLLGYFVTLIPFMLVNGILTGSFLDEPIVIYNDSENLSLRVGTVPIEDSVYLLGLLLLNITIYEKIKSLKTIQSS